MIDSPDFTAYLQHLRELSSNPHWFACITCNYLLTSKRTSRTHLEMKHKVIRLVQITTKVGMLTHLRQNEHGDCVLKLQEHKKDSEYMDGAIRRVKGQIIGAQVQREQILEALGRRWVKLHWRQQEQQRARGKQIEDLARKKDRGQVEETLLQVLVMRRQCGKLEEQL